MQTVSFSVVIPLYNKRHGIVRAVRSIVEQSLPPQEVIVVDDGSTDGSAELVEELALPGVRLIKQANAGVSCARNRGMAEAKGEYIALLDADDWWEKDFLRHIADLILAYPGCGAYSTGYKMLFDGKIYPCCNKLSDEKGPIKNYFLAAFTEPILLPSSSAIPRVIFDRLGGFPEGMRNGEDLWMWIKIALEYKICHDPALMSNHEPAGVATRPYRPDANQRSYMEFFTPGQQDLNEYIARIQIGVGLEQTKAGYTVLARETARQTAYTRHYRMRWHELRILNAMPAGWRPTMMKAFDDILRLGSKIKQLVVHTC